LFPEDQDGRSGARPFFHRAEERGLRGP
jgi:hypothetical protein